MAEQNAREARAQQRDDARQMDELTNHLRAALERIQVLEQAQNQQANQPNPQPNQEAGNRTLYPAGESYKPTVFKGGYNPTAQEWFARFEEIATAHRWEGNRRAEVLSLFLAEGALQEYRKLDDATRADYAACKEALVRVL